MLPTAALPQRPPEVAYFCAEFGLEPALPFFAGGLGILAGDVLKQAADEDFPMVGVSLFYHGKRDRQIIQEDGWQRYEDYTFDVEAHEFHEVRLPDGTPWQCAIPLGDEVVLVYALARQLSPNVIIYFLETDREENPWHFRDLTLAPYWGDERQQLSQQFVLGCAGVKLLADLNILPQTFHLNEGRPSLLFWELAAMLRETQGLSAEAALVAARQKMVYTNHTLVRAGNMSYPFALVDEFLQPWAKRLGIPTSTLLTDGLGTDPNRFEITHFALRMSRKASGVSEPHTKLCRRQSPEFDWVNITNGIHFPTWQGLAWSQAAKSSPEALWYAHLQGKRELAAEAQRRTGITYDTDRLVLGWARRVTGYKRLDSIFKDLSMLKSILNDAAMPVQLVVAGKAHPGDEFAIKLIQSVIQIFQHELWGAALYLPNYDLELAQKMVEGVDVWLNTPEPGHEACGTSGMKAAANGVLQATVLDGWTTEVDWKDVGWVLDPREPGLDLLADLQHEIKPLFWDRQDGIPLRWVERMRRTLAVAGRYSAERMLQEYREKLYQESPVGGDVQFPQFYH